MLTGVILGVFIVPVLFVIFQYLQERFVGKRAIEAHSKPVTVVPA
jgi:hypothetical protein